MTDPVPQQAEVDAVVIGRNEGERLLACLASLQGQVRRIIYVDSGSTDGSVDAARHAGAEVFELDMSRPFTAARARNAGLACLPDTGLVQLVDGDCRVDPDWIKTAVEHLQNTPKAAVVCGRRRETAPEASVYNRLCDAEWDTPVGEALACGGDALMRLEALREVGGFRDDLIAGEEPELCLRLRHAGWSVWRLDAEMTRHDAAMTRFGQWWQRTRRAGHAFAEGAFLHGAGPEKHWVAETRRAVIWGGALPLVAVVASLWLPLGWVLWLAYPLQVMRLALKWGANKSAWERAVFTVLGKIPEAIGAIEFHLRRFLGRQRGLVEYK